MKIVIDTNVAVSGLLWGGAPNQILKFCRNRRIQILECDDTLGEIKRVLHYEKLSKRLSDLSMTAMEVYAYFVNLTTYVSSPGTIPDTIKADPFDNLFLGLAGESNASLIVSGDRHLLDLKDYAGIQIVTPSESVNVISHVFKQHPRL